MDTADLVHAFQRDRQISDADMLEALVVYIGNQRDDAALGDFLTEYFDEFSEVT